MSTKKVKVALQAPKPKVKFALKKEKPVELAPVVEAVAAAEPAQDIKPKLIRQSRTKKAPVVEVEPETTSENEAEATDPADTFPEPESEEETPHVPLNWKPARGRPTGKKTAEPKEPSLWLVTLREHGFMIKGGAFKPTPKKGSDDYNAVRAAFDAKKAALSA